MGYRLGGILVVGLVCLLASCSENGLLTPLSSQSNQVRIASVPDGTMVSGGQSINLAVTTSGGQVSPGDLKVEILDSSGAVVQTADIKNVDFTQPLAPLELPNLQTGAYTLRLTLYGTDNSVLAQQKVNIFYVTGSYSLDGVNSYPPALPPGASGVLVAKIGAPPGANPYLRWTMGNNVIGQGYLSDGYNQVQWTAPSSTGVYSITVELFPYGPPTGGSFDFTSPYSLKVEVFVTNSASVAGSQLGPSSSYYALYHLRGSLKNSGVGLKNADATAIGSPSLSVSGNVFGYLLDGSSGFSIPAMLLPTKGDGTLEPFSVTMKLQLTSANPNRTFFVTGTAGGAFTFGISSDAVGKLVASLNGQAEQNDVSLTPGELHTVTLSVVPKPKLLGLLWFVDGHLVLSDSLPSPPSSLSGTGGQTIIGGTNGFTGLLQEFGVYYRDPQGRPDTDPEVFRQAMQQEYGSNLVFAEGFDGIYLPPDLHYTGNITDSQVGSGVLILHPSQSVALPAIAVGEDDLSVVIKLPSSLDKGEGTIELVGQGKTLATLATSKAVDAKGEVDLALTPVSGGTRVTGNGINTLIPSNAPELSVRIDDTGSGSLAVRSILITKHR